MSKLSPGLRIVLMMIWATVLVAGCSKRNIPFGEEGEAVVHLSVGLDTTENEQSISKTSQPTLDPYQDLAVYIINTHEDTLARYASFNEVPSTLKFTPGAYKIVAEYKPEGSKIPAFDTYIYRAEEKFVIAAGDELDIALVAKLATAKISVEFDENFGFYYADYSVDIRTKGADSLRFEKDETRSGFFEPGSVRMRFNLVTDKGEELTFSPEPLAKADAADWYKLKLKVSSDQGSSQVIIIGTDDELNPEKDITVEIPRYFLPKDKPTVTPTGFVSGVQQSVFEGEVPKWNYAAHVPGGVYSLVIRMNDGASGALASKLDGVTEIDLAALGAKDPMREKLRAAGFVWSEGLNSPEDAAISTDVWIDFTGCMTVSETGSATYDFGFELTDNYDQTPEVDNPCVVKAEIKSPTVLFSDIAEADIWAKRAFFTIKANYDILNGTHPVLQYRRTSSDSWNSAVEGSDVTVTALNGGVADEQGMFAAQYVLKGLQPGTEYEFRVMANEEGISPSQPVWTTEQALGVPGLVDGGFATGWNEEASTTALGVTVQAPPAGWATRNPLTTSQAALSQNPLGSGVDVAVSEVSANNGATLVTNPGNYVRKAVQLRTTAWGRGCYSKSGGDDKGWYGSLLLGKGKVGSPELGARVRNTSAGILFLGTYSFSQPSNATETWEYYEADFSGLTTKPYTTKLDYVYDAFVAEEKTEGAAFVSRPATLSFQYQFTPVAGTSGFYVRAALLAADGSQIAEATCTDATEQSAMSKRTLTFNYSDTSKPAATICLLFSSDADLSVGTSGGMDIPASPLVVKQTNGDPHVGNMLLIDNVELGYDFE